MTLVEQLRLQDLVAGIDPSLPKDTFVVQASPDVLERLKKFLAYVQYCSGVGHSCVVGFDIDGDGADRFVVKSPKFSKVKEAEIVDRNGAYEVLQ